ncbi:MAG: nicotinamide-nucleotide amidohydrolase family protein [Butyrivibrio sp.]|nr:nicotinamide-nucleotide amidohydrolase family protein [Butyrivibrio sp.]
MRIINLVEDTLGKNECTPEHGLCFYVETKNHKILVDTGASDLFAENADKLGIDLEEVDTVVISHGHYDHGGGIIPFSKINDSATIYVRKSAFGKHYSTSRGEDPQYVGLEDKAKRLPQIVMLEEGVTEIDDELTIFSDIGDAHEAPATNKDLFVKRGFELREDSFTHEQCLVVTENKRRYLFSGCAHTGIQNILDRYEELFDDEPYAVISGFHTTKHKGFSKDDIDFIRDMAKDLDKYNTIFYTCHCTGVKPYREMKKILEDKIRYVHCGDEIKVGRRSEGRTASKEAVKAPAKAPSKGPSRTPSRAAAKPAPKPAPKPQRKPVHEEDDDDFDNFEKYDNDDFESFDNYDDFESFDDVGKNRKSKKIADFQDEDDDDEDDGIRDYREDDEDDIDDEEEDIRRRRGSKMIRRRRNEVIEEDDDIEDDDDEDDDIRDYRDDEDDDEDDDIRDYRDDEDDDEDDDIRDYREDEDYEDDDDDEDVGRLAPRIGKRPAPKPGRKAVSGPGKAPVKSAPLTPPIANVPAAKVPVKRPSIDKPALDKPRADRPRPERQRPEKPAAERPRPEKPVAERTRSEKSAGERVRAEKPVVEKARQVKVKAERSRPEKTIAEKPAVQMPKPEKPVAEKPRTVKPKQDKLALGKPGMGPAQSVYEDAVRAKYQKITSILIERKLTFTSMESCTSGLIASLISDTEGASAIMKGAYITYSNEAKTLHGVPEDTIEHYGAYSYETAEDMAFAAGAIYEADVAIGVTGTLGNVDYANPESVPGEVFFAIASTFGNKSYHANLPEKSSRYEYKLAVAELVADKLLEILGE